MTITELRRPSLRRRIDVRAFDVLPADFTRAGALGWRVDGHEVTIGHCLTVDSISDDSAVRAVARLVDDGVVVGQDEFESAMTGLISTSGPTADDGWSAFFTNSLTALRAGTAEFAPVHRRARSLLVGTSVLEVGCCFGLLALQCAQDGWRVDACDICPAALVLLDRAGRRLGLDVRTRRGDARALPYPDGGADTVTLVHLLEHLAPSDVQTAIGQALRVARRRVVIAVPFEDEPAEHFGHRQRLSEADLHEWAAPWISAGLDADVVVDHGGWLILDRPRQ
ncbi:mycofactocin oligosaccharide methyltransferase MftM [Gordonia humi]|uniref:SAM-dependent methyltransferase n=1 Tax=Gordonia humi TaxID=686429 RepID=A0A840F8I1_9ACTN|nr:mycofactocin oligosaccharide methyltransferase MftM [Gordonia humi]MBB4135827.1 SAM-dependent methyltransferase [Gordonia humi]